MYWANFMHIYQPPTQLREITEKVTHECYQKLVAILKAYPSAKISLNINACLTDQLYRYHLKDVIHGLRDLAENGQIEFTGSAMYHPVLPLIPEKEVIRQIQLNTEINQRYFGKVFDPKGFFPPEMCYSSEVARIAKNLGFEWIIMDEIGYNGKLGRVKSDTLYKLEGLGDFMVFFKERPYSAGLTYGSFSRAHPFLKHLGEALDKNCYLLTGSDGEIYGHHRPGQEELLKESFAEGRPKTCTISELKDLFTKVETTNPLPSSWSTWEDEMAQGIPYPQWSYPENEIHKMQWELTYLVLELINRVPNDAAGFEEARILTDEGLHSCQYWWASCRPWWDTDMIERGAEKLYLAVQAIKQHLEPNEVNEVKRLRKGIGATAKLWHEWGKAKRLKEQYLDGHRDVASQLTFGSET